MDKVDGYGHDYGYSHGDEKRLRLVSHLDSSQCGHWLSLV